jgi:hypothetical protein
MMRRLLTAAAILTGLLLSPVSAPAEPVPAAGPSGALDARAAAAGEGGLTQAGAKGGVGVQASWYSGTVAAGATQSWYWNNANPLQAGYEVGFSPVGATTSSSCRFETLTTTYQQWYGGERKFLFVIKNVGSLACGTTILLSSNDGGYIGSTGGLNPGQPQTWKWYIPDTAADSNPVQVLGVSPVGATSSSPCQIELVSTSYQLVGGFQWEFYFTVRNAGSIACSANLYLGAVNSQYRFEMNKNLEVGETYYATWYNANPTNAVYLAMASPAVFVYWQPCDLEVVRSYYSQVVNASGYPERRFHLEIRNNGPWRCPSPAVYLATIAA